MHPFSIIVPVYNEQEILEVNTKKLLEHCSALGAEFEIILVDNGSSDLSAKIGSDLAQQFTSVKIFSISQKGVGRAFKKGIKASRYDHIIFMDADLSADLSFIDQSNALLDKNVLVMGAKFKGLQDRGTFRKIGSFVFYLSVLVLMGMRYVDYAPGAKAYQKEFLLKYFKYIDDYTSFVLNLSFMASIKKESIAEIPITCEDHRKSKFNLLHEAVRKYRGLLSLKSKQLLGKL